MITNYSSEGIYMTTSEKQVQANRANATRSTGPRSPEGKAKSRLNAVRHGLFSKHLFLNGEQPEDYHALEEDLQLTLRPIGALEQTLIEQIAVNMWKQRRLIHAETAMINQGRKPSQICKEVSLELDKDWSNTISESELHPYDKKQEVWCRDVMKEYQSLSEFRLISLTEKAPLILQFLVDEADSEHKSIADYLAPYGDKTPEALMELIKWCQMELKKADQSSKIQSAVRQVQNRKSVLPEKYLELMARYQTSLDNQLYKAMKALRESQEWRLKLQRDERINNSIPNNGYHGHGLVSKKLAPPEYD
jgi:hypothetical protein